MPGFEPDPPEIEIVQQELDKTQRKLGLARIRKEKKGDTDHVLYDAAEGILTASILLVAEFCPEDERHIVSVFKIIQELLAPSKKKGTTQFQLLMSMLPAEHKARWFAGAALSTSEQAMNSVMSTALSRLNAFLDSEMEQLLCFDTAIDAESFCKEKSAVFLIMPEEDPNKFFMVGLNFRGLAGS